MNDFYSNIILNDEETEAAIFEGKKRKYFLEKNKDYWIEQEKKGIENHEEEKRLNRIKSKLKPSFPVLTTQKPSVNS